MGSLIDSITGAKSARKASKRAAEQARFQDFTSTTPFGTGEITRGGLTTGGGPGADLAPGFERLGAQFQQAVGGAPVGSFDAIDPNSAFAAALSLGQQNQQLQGNALGFLDASQGFLSDLDNFDSQAFAQQQKGRLDSLAVPFEQRAASSLADRLFSQGRLGGNDTRSGRAFGDLAQSQQRADTERSLAAIGLANQETGRISKLAQSFGGSGLQQLLGGNQVAGGSIQNFLAALQGGSGLAGAQAGLSESLLNRSLGATGGISSSLAPSQQNIQNLLASSGLVQAGNVAGANIFNQGGQAAADARGNLLSGALNTLDFNIGGGN